MIDNRDLVANRERIKSRYGIASVAVPKPVGVDETVDEEFYYASQWRLMWWRFRQHRMALISAALLICLYLIALFADFIAPYSATTRFRGFQQAPPSVIYFADENGLRAPFVYGSEREIDPDTRRRTVVGGLLLALFQPPAIRNAPSFNHTHDTAVTI